MQRRQFLGLLTTVSANAADRFQEEWRSVAEHLIETPVRKYPWNWGEGVQFIGLMRVHERTGEARYADYVERWLAHFATEDLPRMLREGTADSKTKPGYCGLWSPGTVAALLFESRRKPGHLRMAAQVLDFVNRSAERSPDHALGHWTGSHQLWVDTLYMACPLFAVMSRIQRNPRLIDEAANQILAHVKRLQDPRNGLFYHMWDWHSYERTRDLWGRGNGWVLMSIADTIELMHKSDTHYASLLSVATRMAQGLIEYQTSAGLFRTVLDDVDSYPEISATAMVVYGFLKLIRLGVLPESYQEAALRAWTTINRQTVRGGEVIGVSAGTVPGTRDQYKGIPLGRQTWGTGAYLLAGSEVDRLVKPEPVARRPF